MLSISALSISPDVKDWLLNSRQPRFLHIFERACNLINESKEVMSIVLPQIGDGPFSLVVADDICFSRYISLQSQVTNKPDQLCIGDLTIHTANAKLWNPCPDWEALHARRDEITSHLKSFPILDDQLSTPNSLISNLSIAIASEDISIAKANAAKLAGLGQGLTPAGDDFILGAIYAAWIIHPPETASLLARGMADIVVPLTTSLSAAWLRSSGKGEAGKPWHEFFEGLLLEDPSRIQEAAGNILAIGETSGVEALAGFMGTLMRWGERQRSKIP